MGDLRVPLLGREGDVGDKSIAFLAVSDAQQQQYSQRLPAFYQSLCLELDTPDLEEAQGRVLTVAEQQQREEQQQQQNGEGGHSFQPLLDSEDHVQLRGLSHNHHHQQQQQGAQQRQPQNALTNSGHQNEPGGVDIDEWGESLRHQQEQGQQQYEYGQRSFQPQQQQQQGQGQEWEQQRERHSGGITSQLYALKEAGQHPNGINERQRAPSSTEIAGRSREPSLNSYLQVPQSEAESVQDQVVECAYGEGNHDVPRKRIPEVEVSLQRAKLHLANGVVGPKRVWWEVRAASLKEETTITKGTTPAAQTAEDATPACWPWREGSMLRTAGKMLTSAVVGPYHLLRNGTKFEKAAALVNRALDGTGIPPPILQGLESKQAYFEYFVYTRFDNIFSFVLFVLICLNFCEVPAWCSQDFPNPCGDPTVYPLWDVGYIKGWHSLIIEILCWAVLSLQVFVPLAIVGPNAFFNYRLHGGLTAALGVYAIDIVIFAIYVLPSPPLFARLPFRGAPYLRILIWMLQSWELRRVVRIVGGIVDDTVDIGGLLIFVVLFSSALALVLFKGRDQGAVFYDYGNTVYQMFVLLTTSNNPDVWLPAYHERRAACLFFMAFLVVGIYFVMNVVLAVVYNSFKEQLEKHVLEDHLKDVGTLNHAFDLIDVDGQGYLDIEQCTRILQGVNLYRSDFHIEKERLRKIILDFDTSGDFRIQKDEFVHICRNMDEVFAKSKKQQRPFLEIWSPAAYHSAAFQALRTIITGSSFPWVMMVVQLANAVCVVGDTWNEESHTRWYWVVAQRCIAILFVLEVILKVAVKGVKGYFKQTTNCFEFLLTIALVGGEVFLTFYPDEPGFTTADEWLRVVLVAQLLRLLRVLFKIPRYGDVITTFSQVAPSLRPMLAFMFCVFSVFSSAGVHLFGGLVYWGNEALLPTEFHTDNYYETNFNDYPAGLVLLFNVLIDNNWHVFTDGYTAVTGTWFTRLFFVAFFLLVVVFLLSLVTAFVLDAFFAQQQVANQTPPHERQHTIGSSERVRRLMNHIVATSVEARRPSVGSSPRTSQTGLNRFNSFPDPLRAAAHSGHRNLSLSPEPVSPLSSSP